MQSADLKVGKLYCLKKQGLQFWEWDHPFQVTVTVGPEEIVIYLGTRKHPTFNTPWYDFLAPHGMVVGRCMTVELIKENLESCQR